MVFLDKFDTLGCQRGVAQVIVANLCQLVGGRLFRKVYNAFFQPEQVVVFHVGFEAVVVVGGQGEMVVKAEFIRTRFDFSRPVGDAGLAVSQMPLADMGCSVALLLKKPR